MARESDGINAGLRRGRTRRKYGTPKIDDCMVEPGFRPQIPEALSLGKKHAVAMMTNLLERGFREDIVIDLERVMLHHWVLGSYDED